MRSIGVPAIAAFCIPIVMGATAGTAWPDEGKCLIRVDGRAYLNGTCNIEIRAGGSFTVGVGEGKRSEYFAAVNIEGPNTARGSWNGIYAEEHAHSDLGLLIRKGACWSNARARICAWRR